MTELLYMGDNYVKEFDAVVTKVGDDYLTLDKTAFYPEGGGQFGDKGWISVDDTEVEVDTTKRQKGEVCHMVDDTTPFVVGTKVTGKLDWERRYRCMRFHTAQHVLSRHLQMKYNLVTVGNQIKPDRSRADYSPLESFDESMKKDVERAVNALIQQEMDVKISFMPRNEAIDYLKERGYQTRYLMMVPEHVKEFRVIEMENFDAASCAGTHVANTSEIRGIRLGKSKNVGAGKQRIYFTLVD